MFPSRSVRAPLVMGVLNVTPDSFSDGGLFTSRDEALRQVEKMVLEGADIVDIGGESSRPGADGVSIEEEKSRVLPIIAAIRESFSIRISIDTTKYEVACDAVALGATIVNDISGGEDIRMAKLAKDANIDVILMHKKGNPATMQDAPTYRNGVVGEVKEYLKSRRRAFKEYGVDPKRVWVDPGIGFGKTLEHNLDLLRHIQDFVPIDGRLVIGTSRKSFLANLLGDPKLGFEERREGTVVSNLWAYTHGASVFRVHDVGNFRRALKTWESILYGSLA